MAGSAHTDVAAYVLGVLGEADSARFEEHLMDCPHCQLDLLELYQLPDILDLVKKSWPEPPMPAPGVRALAPGPRVLRALMEEAAVKRKRRRRLGFLGAAAAAVAVIAGPLVTMAVRPADAIGPQAAPVPTVRPETSPAAASASLPPPSSQAPPSSAAPTGQAGAATSFGRADAGSSVSAQVTVSPREWGAAVELELRGIVGPMVCELRAITRDGPKRVADWKVPAKGYGIAGSPEPLRIGGDTSLSLSDITRFEVRTEDNTLLVAIVR
ncbi:zf-HC2 domain-containing protein [Amycolatopsis sp. NPDC059027]|uniref:zf-HC2 domain-containing protein n=1 Tax=unclassified Amycolatopsis TaxID=2618356 RepID=UPI00366C1645